MRTWTREAYDVSTGREVPKSLRTILGNPGIFVAMEIAVPGVKCGAARWGSPTRL
jgi:hypothetical protein